MMVRANSSKILVYSGEGFQSTDATMLIAAVNPPVSCVVAVRS
jgi:hypothetical protein